MKGTRSVLVRKKTILFISMVFLFAVSQVWGADSDYYGTYAGTFTGDDSGQWVAVISASDSVFLSYSSSGGGDGGYLYGSEGTYHSTSQMNSTYITANIDSGGNVTGDWDNSYEGEDGTIEGSKITSISFSGSYSGSLSGDASGSWSMNIQSNGYITGSVTVEGETFSFEGGAHPDGYVIVVGTDDEGDDFVVYGRASDSSISGSWESESGAAGSFSTGGGGGDDDGGGGCFIRSILP